MTLKNKTLKALKWNSIDQFSLQLITFVVSLILAKILGPEIFGTLAIINGVIAISGSFVDSGFGSALIQKKNANEQDFSTVFYVNIILGLLLTAVIYSLAPFLGSYYQDPQITKITKVMAFLLIIKAFGLVQKTILNKQLDFKSTFKVSFISTISSGILGLYLAFKGYGAWSLVFQILSLEIFRTILLWVVSVWRPKLIFDYQSLKELFGFGSRLLLAGVFNVIFDNIFVFIVGSKYTKTDLGYYKRAKTIQEFPIRLLTKILNVVYPSFNNFQHDDPRLRSAFSKVIKLAAFITFPVMLGVSAVAAPLIHVVLGDKWLESIPYLQIFCWGGIIYPLSYVLLQSLFIKGQSKTFLKIEIIKKIVFMTLASIGLCFSIKGMVVGMVLSAFTNHLINSITVRKVINYTLRAQFIDIWPSLIIALIMFGSLKLSLLWLNLGHLYLLLIQVILGMVIYLGLHLVFRTKPYKQSLNLMLYYLKKT